MAAHSGPAPSGLDPAAIERLEAGLPQGSLNALLRLFADELARRRVVLERLADDGDMAALGCLAHSLQGSAATYGAPGVARAAADLGRQVKAGGRAGVASAVGELIVELTHVLDELELRLG